MGNMRMLIVFSRSISVNRSTSSAMKPISASPQLSVYPLKRACTVTSSPTMFISVSSFAAGTRNVAAASAFFRFSRTLSKCCCSMTAA